MINSFVSLNVQYRVFKWNTLYMYLINVSYGQDNNVGHPNSCRNDKTQWFAPLYCRFEKLICCICACSSVSSNGLLGKMHSHFGCIYLAFPHYVLKNVSSNGLPERMQSHTDITFVWLFSTVRFKCLLKLPSREDAKSHWLHLFDFSPLCVFECVLKLPAWEDE